MDYLHAIAAILVLTAHWARVNTFSVYDVHAPPPVVSAIRCLRKLDLKTYRATGSFKTSGELYQRLTESAWPIEIDEKSEALVYLASDAVLLCDSLQLLCQEEGVHVAVCPR